MKTKYLIINYANGSKNEVYLNVVLNRHKRDDLFYRIKEPVWHECKIKVNNSWRTFVLKFNSQDSEEFNRQLEEVFADLQAEDDVLNTYLLVAVPVKEQPLHNTETEAGSPEAEQFVIEFDDLTNLDQSALSRRVSEHFPTSGEAEVPFDPGPPPSELPVPLDPAPPTCEISIYPAPPPCVGSYNATPPRFEAPFDPVPFDPAPFDPAPFVPLTHGVENRCRTISVTDTEHTALKEELINANEISDLCDSLHIHPKELPRRLTSILNSIGSVGNDLGSENQRLDSGNLISEEIYMQMGVEKKMSVPNPPSTRLQEAMTIAKSLQTAINEGNQQIAVMNAVKLAADDNVTVTIEVKEKASLPDERDALFSLKVYIEDKDTSGGHIILKVRSSDTIGDLKQRMSFKHQFPEEIQSWIIGKRIPGDHETLGYCKIKGPGHSAYLYLRTPKSVGLTFEAYQKRRMEQLYPAGDGSPVVRENQVPVGATVAPVKVDQTYMAMNAFPKTPAVTSGSAGSQPGSREPASATPPFKPAQAVKREPKALADNLNIPTQKAQKQKQMVQGKVRDQGRIPEDHPLELTGHDMNAMLQQLSNFRVQDQAHPRVPVMHPEEDPNIGWVCSACTYINKPTRPGCEVCTQTRPPDYNVPDNYVLSPEEQDWLKQEASLERQTKEADNPEREYDDYEQKQLENIRKFHEALQDVVTNERSGSEGDNYRAYNIPPKLDISGLFVKARKDPVEINDDSP